MLSGGKVTEFAPGLLGDPYAIAVDMHVASVLFGTKDPNDFQRFAGQLAIMRVAKRMGWTPAEVQAAIFADHIQRDPKGVMERAEKYMEDKRNEFIHLVEADVQAGGKGASIGGRILERASQRIGPERLLKDQGGLTETIREARAEAILDPQGRPAREMAKLREAKLVKVDPVVASAISLRGPVGPSALRGRSKSASAPATTATNRRVPPFWKRSIFFYNGVKQVMWNSPGMAAGGDAVHKHVDLRRKYMGEATAPFVKWERTLLGIPNLPGNIGKPTVRSAVSEHEAWRKAKAGGQPLPKLSEAAKRLKDTFDQTIDKINKKNSTLSIKIKNPDTGKYVPIPHMEYPAKIREDIMDAMRDPHNNQSAYNELRDGLDAEGILPKSASMADFDAYVDKVMLGYKSNGAFGSFFFHPKTMPSIAFDYSYRAMHEMLGAWTERVAQHEAFGANPNNDIFDALIAKTRDPESQGWLKAVKRYAYNDNVTDTLGRFTTLLGHLATVKHLASFAGAVKNLITGMGFNAASLGPRHFLTGLLTGMPFRMHIDAIERGILIRDLPNVLADGQQIPGAGVGAKIGRAISAAPQLGLQVSGFNAAEVWNRGVAMRGLESLLRQALKAYKNNPRSKTSLRYMAYFQRLGFREGRAELLMQEGGRGELTDEFLRAGVNEIHGGYTYADVNVFMQSGPGRMLFKYQKWGAEQAKHFVREVLKPALRTLPLAPREKIQVIDPSTGKPMDIEVPKSVKDLMPLAYYIFIVAGAAAGDEWLLEQLFGMHSKTISLAQAMDKYKRDKLDGFKAFAEKLWMLHMHAGGFGALGAYVQDAAAFFGVTEKQGPTKSLAESIPALDPYLEFYDFIMTAYEQGGVGAKDFDRAADGIAIYRTSKQFAATQFHRLGYKRFGNDVIGQIARHSEIIANRQDLSVVKNLQRRYMDETKQHKKGIIGGRMEKDPSNLWKEPLDDALSIGDVVMARQILSDVKKGMTPARWEVESDALKKHILAKHPLGQGAASQQLFLEWAKQGGATPYQLATMRRLQKTYEQTARQLSLGMEFSPPSIEDVMEKRQMIQLRAQPTTY